MVTVLPIDKWASAGAITNPVLGAVLADTGQMPQGYYRLTLLISAAIAVQVQLERRDSTNSTTIDSQQFFIAANQTIIINIDAAPVFCDEGERFRVYCLLTVVGIVQASIFFN